MSKFFKSQFKGLNKSILFNPFKKKDAIPPVQQTSQTGAGSGGTSVAAAEVKQVKETLIQRFKNYIIMVINDYKQVGKDTLVHMKDHPVKTTVYGVITGTFLVAYKYNPDYQNYIGTRRSQANEMITCGSGYSRRTEYYLNSLNKLEYCSMLEYKSYFVFSLIMARNFSQIDSSYEKQCASLNNPNKYNIFNYFNLFLRFLSHIVDIGFMENWYFLNKNFQDYDVNEEEWDNNISN